MCSISQKLSLHHDMYKEIWIQQQRWGSVHFYKSHSVAHEFQIKSANFRFWLTWMKLISFTFNLLLSPWYRICNSTVGPLNQFDFNAWHCFKGFGSYWSMAGHILSAQEVNNDKVNRTLGLKSKCPSFGLVDRALADFISTYCDELTIITSSVQGCWATRGLRGLLRF